MQAQCRQLVTYSDDYQLIVEQLYKMGVNGILCRCVLDHEWDTILYEAHEGITGGNNSHKSMMNKVFHLGLC